MVSSIVSIRATWSPPPCGRPQLVERRHRRARDVGEALLELVLGDPDLRRRSPRRSARASASAPARRSPARSPARARGRERGTQSSERSSSMIAPLIRAIAYVSNLISRSGSKRSIAPISPSSPYETRSCSSTCDGRLEPETTGDELHERRVRQDQAVARSARSCVARYSCHSACVSPPGACSCAARAPSTEGRRYPPKQNTPSVGRLILAELASSCPIGLARLAGPDPPSRARAPPPRTR